MSFPFCFLNKKTTPVTICLPCLLPKAPTQAYCAPGLGGHRAAGWGLHWLLGRDPHAHVPLRAGSSRENAPEAALTCPLAGSGGVLREERKGVSIQRKEGVG